MRLQDTTFTPRLEPIVTAYIALGANLGDRAKNLRDALTLLDKADGVRVVQVSSFLENPAVGGLAGSPPFLNAVAEVETTLPAIDLLHRLLDIERSLGRERREKWGPRTLDLDVIVYGEQIIRTPELTVPHPRLQERRFVLQPLAEIAPDLTIPGMDRSVRELLTAIDNGGAGG